MAHLGYVGDSNLLRSHYTQSMSTYDPKFDRFAPQKLPRHDIISREERLVRGTVKGQTARVRLKCLSGGVGAHQTVGLGRWLTPSAHVIE